MQANDSPPTILEDALKEGISLESLRDLAARIWQWIDAVLLTKESLIELGVIALAFVLAFALMGWTRKLIMVIQRYILKNIDEAEIHDYVMPVLYAFVTLVFVLIASMIFSGLGWPTPLMSVASRLLAAWVVIRAVSNLIGEPFWARTVAIIAWGLAFLSILGLLGPLADFLDAIGFTFGEGRISVLLVLQAVSLVIALLWLANFLSKLLQSRIDKLPALTPSVRILVGKVSRIGLIALALFIALTSVGIDLSIFAVLGGAIGIGVGFGLQKIVGNFVSGLILLMDRSIKPGDVIEVLGTYGWVKSLGARYTSVVTRDGHEFLIPNEDFIVNTVTNWSFSDRLVRVKRPVGVAYGTDVLKAIDLVIEAAGRVERVLKDPEVKCLLTGFGDNSIDLEVRFWLRDPESGVANVSSEVLLEIWKTFDEHGIEFPFPQRDIHIKELPEGFAGLTS
ncbi:MAG: mechanosensitive ion channel [Alphaproteobacteria bacterium]|nr:MAG: mechanosensitive ion channel [Alphaproteobacteria bacterium]